MCDDVSDEKESGEEGVLSGLVLTLFLGFWDWEFSARLIGGGGPE